MALSDDDLAWVRSELGSGDPPSDVDLGNAFDRLGTKEAVVLEELRKRRAELLSAPASFSVPGYSQSTAANIAALDRQIALVQGGLESGGITVVQLVRPDLQRRQSCTSRRVF